MSKDQIKAQATKLVSLLKAHDGPVRYQDALELLAQLNGHKNWKTMSGLLDKPNSATTPASDPGEPSRFQRFATPEGEQFTQTEIPGTGFLYRVPVTVDVTQTAVVLVRAGDVDEAVDLARALVAAGGAPMELDEGNYRGLADYYCPDKQDGVYPLAEVAGLPHEPGCDSAQAGPFLVELGKDSDGIWWASLCVYLLPDANEMETSTWSTSFLVDPAEVETPEARTAFCKAAAKELFRLFGADDIDTSRVEGQFLRISRMGASR